MTPAHGFSGICTEIAYRFFVKLMKTFMNRPVLIRQYSPLEHHPVVFAANHEGSWGPLALLLWLPYGFRPWVIHDMTTRGLCRRYLEKDFTAGELGLPAPLAGVLACWIEPVILPLMKKVGAIPVHAGTKKMEKTIELSVKALEEGISLLVFPETRISKIEDGSLDFHSGFIRLAKYYHELKGECLQFVPLTCSRKESVIIIGRPAVFRPDNPLPDEKSRILAHLSSELTLGYARASVPAEEFL